MSQIWYVKYVMIEKPALNPSPEFVSQQYRSMLLGALLRSQLNLYQARRITEDLLDAMQLRIRQKIIPKILSIGCKDRCSKSTGVAFIHWISKRMRLWACCTPFHIPP